MEYKFCTAQVAPKLSKGYTRICWCWYDVLVIAALAVFLLIYCRAIPANLGDCQVEIRSQLVSILANFIHKKKRIGTVSV